MKKILIILFLFIILTPNTKALTENQIYSILNVLTAFSVDLETINNVELALKGPRVCAELSVSWQRTPGAEEYHLYRNGLLVYQGDNLSFRDQGLIPGNFYSYTLFASNRSGMSERSEIKKTFAPLVCPPTTPSLFFKAEPCGGNITVFWNRVPEATSYRLLRDNREIWRGLENQFIDKNLRVNREYSYQIQAINEGGVSPVSSVYKFKASDICPPDQPKFVQEEIKKEGFLNFSLRTTPRDGSTIRTARSNQSIIAFNLGAIYSNITIQRVNFLFDKNLFLYAEKVRLRAGSRTLKEIELDRNSLTRINNNYRLSFTDLNYNITKDRSIIFTLQISTKEDVSGEVKVSLERNSIRGIDQINIYHYIPSESFFRNFIIQ